MAALVSNMSFEIKGAHMIILETRVFCLNMITN